MRVHYTFVLAALVLGAGAWRWHPVHAARVEVTSSGREVAAVVRVYRADFPPGSDSVAALQYVGRTVRLRDGAGVMVELQLVSLVPEGDRLRIALRGTSATPLTRGTLAVTLLQERFADQVNVATVRIDDRRTQLVFLRGDAPQALP